jgi:uncharacterized protein
VAQPNQSDGADDVRQRLRGALLEAMRSRDVAAASALRSGLAAIDNAEAIPVGQPTATATSSPHFAGAAAGLGAAEAQRRSLAEAQMLEIIDAEIAERLTAAAEYDGLGYAQQGGRLRREAQVLRDVIGPVAG